MSNDNWASWSHTPNNQLFHSQGAPRQKQELVHLVSALTHWLSMVTESSGIAWVASVQGKYPCKYTLAQESSALLWFTTTSIQKHYCL